LKSVIPVNKWRRAFRARTNVDDTSTSPEEWWKPILEADGLFHWKDLTFDLRHERNTLFIRDEVLDGGEYDFHTSKPCVVLDIGMNIGDTPLYFARMTHVKKVYAYEPFKATYDWAVSNFALNPEYCSKIVPVCAGVSDKSRTIEIAQDYQDGTGGASIDIVNEEHRKVIDEASYILKTRLPAMKQKIRVEGAADVVREILKSHPNEALVVKCDAEGSEWRIMSALRDEGLLRKVYILMLEYHYQPPVNLLKMLTNAGFVCFLRDLKNVKKAEIGSIYAVQCTAGTEQL
ncbi:MAG: FkbM family methyltransferase, partial [Deltaproteobacteria bacterium]